MYGHHPRVRVDRRLRPVNDLEQWRVVPQAVGLGVGEGGQGVGVVLLGTWPELGAAEHVAGGERGEVSERNTN